MTNSIKERLLYRDKDRTEEGRKRLREQGRKAIRKYFLFKGRSTSKDYFLKIKVKNK